MSYAKRLVSVKWYELNGSLQHKKLLTIIELELLCKELFKRGVVHFWIRHPSRNESKKFFTRDFLPKQLKRSVQDAVQVRICPVCNTLERTIHITCALQSTLPSCSKACSPSDFYKGGYCDKNGCFH